MSKDTTKLVPWTSWDEWKQVCGWLWSDVPEEQLKGIRRVTAWRARGKLPVSVEITLNFVEIVRRDDRQSAQALKFQKLHRMEEVYSTRTKGSELNEWCSEPRSEIEKRMMYSMALTRMINGLAAPYQQSVHAKSVAGICRMLELPTGLIELRHEAAHSEIPSLAKLRLAAYQAMSWLYERYWLRQATYFDDLKSSTHTSLEKLAKLRKSITADGAHELPDIAALRRESYQTIQQITSSLSQSQVLICLVPTLLEMPLLIPNKIQASQATRKYTEVPRRLLKMWMSVIEAFTKQWDCFLPALLVTIVSKLFATTRLLPKYNASISSNRRGLEDTDLLHKFVLSLLRCWYEHLIDFYYPVHLDATAVEEAATKVDEEEEEEKPSVEENGQEEIEKDPQMTAENGEDKDNSEDPNPSTSHVSKKKKNRNQVVPRPAPKPPKPTKKKSQPKLDSATLPIKAILHICFHHMNKQSLKLIKLTLRYMPSGKERDSILPKLKTLFHFRSRAMNIVKAEEARKSGGSNSEERFLKLHERASRNSDVYSSQMELSLEDFERLISARSTPMMIAATNETDVASGKGDGERTLSAATPSTVVNEESASATAQGDQMAPAESSVVSHAPTSVTPNPLSGVMIPTEPVIIDAQMRAQMWTPVEGTFPSIGMTPNGDPPGDLSLDPSLDRFLGALFLIPRPAPPAASSNVDDDIYAMDVDYAADQEAQIAAQSPAKRGTPTRSLAASPPLLVATSSRLGTPLPTSSPMDYTLQETMARAIPQQAETGPAVESQGLLGSSPGSDAAALLEPEGKRRCPAPEDLIASTTREQEHVVAKPILDVAAEKGKIQLLIKPLTKPQKRKK